MFIFFYFNDSSLNRVTLKMYIQKDFCFSICAIVVIIYFTGLAENLVLFLFFPLCFLFYVNEIFYVQDIWCKYTMKITYIIMINE